MGHEPVRTTRVVYADNYRGFRDCYVDFDAISFLVGENSSGKSSLMGLAHTLLRQDFWTKIELAKSASEFSVFSDLVSRVTDDKERFTIGCLVSVGDAIDRRFGGVITFEEEDGAPVLSKCTYTHGRRIVTFGFEGGECYWSNRGESPGIDGERHLAHLVNLNKSFDFTSSNKFDAKFADRRHALIAVSFYVDQQLVGAGGPETSWNIFQGVGFIGSSFWFDPIRVAPSRFYQVSSGYEFSPSGNHTPYLLKDIFKKRNKLNGSIVKMLNLVGAESGLFGEVKVKQISRSPSSPFSVSVVIDGYDYPIGSVGYGVSQALPLIVELLANPGGEKAFFLQQPEVHLHPKAQAGFSNLLYIYSKEFPASLVAVETHSDYMIDRFRNLRRDGYMGGNDSNSAIYWFERVQGINRVHKMPIGSDGELLGDAPEGYRSFFLSESLRGLGLNVDN